MSLIYYSARDDFAFKSSYWQSQTKPWRSLVDPKYNKEGDNNWLDALLKYLRKFGPRVKLYLNKN
ncbi:MAG: hypothetical protein JNN11_05395 [Candidatus Doudnabacteria bacterium]|nr:hypothetical protein [Candidatus Doudnabacteria bacterium]